MKQINQFLLVLNPNLIRASFAGWGEAVAGIGASRIGWAWQQRENWNRHSRQLQKRDATAITGDYCGFALAIEFCGDETLFI